MLQQHGDQQSASLQQSSVDPRTSLLDMLHNAGMLIISTEPSAQKVASSADSSLYTVIPQAKVTHSKFHQQDLLIIYTLLELGLATISFWINYALEGDAIITVVDIGAG